MKKLVMVLGLLFLSEVSMACSYQGQPCGSGICLCTWNPIALNNDCHCSEADGAND
jgi:hypothetical protein